MSADFDFSRADGVVFDFGGVISVSPKARWETTLYPFCASRGLSRESLERGFAAHRRLWDASLITFAEMYRRIFADAGLDAPGEGDVATLWECDAVGWIAELRADTLALMRELKSAGKRLAILSNMGADYYQTLFVDRCREYRELVDVETISGLEHICKPDREIYDLTSSRLGIAPSRLVFFDDTAVNVEAARSFGWQAELYV